MFSELTDLTDVVDDELPELPASQLLPGHSLGRGRGWRPHQARFGAEDCGVVRGGTRGRHTEIINLR